VFHFRWSNLFCKFKVSLERPAALKLKAAGHICFSCCVLPHQGEKHDPPNGFSASGRHLKVLLENGFDGVASVMTTLFNDAMKLERSMFLEASLYQRKGYVHPNCQCVDEAVRSNCRRSGADPLQGCSPHQRPFARRR